MSLNLHGIYPTLSSASRHKRWPHLPNYRPIPSEENLLLLCISYVHLFYVCWPVHSSAHQDSSAKWGWYDRDSDGQPLESREWHAIIARVTGAHPSTLRRTTNWKGRTGRFKFSTHFCASVWPKRLTAVIFGQITAIALSAILSPVLFVRD